jgi:hypothetical protein
MAKEPKDSKAVKRAVEQYDHKETQRLNNPPIGLVTSAHDGEEPKKTYSYDRSPACGYVGEERSPWIRSAVRLKGSRQEIPSRLPDPVD